MLEPTEPPLALETSALLEKLTLVCETARAMSFSHQNLSLLDALKSQNINISFDASIKLHDLEDGIKELIIQDERFFGENVRFVSTYNGCSGFYPEFVSGPLIRRALSTDNPAEAINWLLKVLRTTSATGTTTNALWGAPVEREITVMEGVKIVPMEALPDSPNKQWVTEHSFAGMQSPVMSILSLTAPQSALVTTHNIEPFIIDKVPEIDDLSLNEDYLKNYELIKEITLALTVVGPRTVISSSQWFTYDDEDLEQACLFSGRSTHMHEISPNRPSTELALNGAETQEIVPAYIALQGTTRAKVRVALQRLNQSLRRHNVGDRAVELATALEALLGDNGTTEMTHKIKVRSVRLIGGTNNARFRNAAIINKTYVIRSTLVHTGRIDASATDTICGERLPISNIVEEATHLCADIIKIIIRSGSIPDWSKFDIIENAQL